MAKDPKYHCGLLNDDGTVCGKPITNITAYLMHQAAVHKRVEDLGSLAAASSSLFAQGPSASAPTAQREGGDPVTTGHCSSCELKEHEKGELRDKATAAEASADQLQRELAAAQQALTKVGEVTTIPPLRDIVATCEGPNCDPTLASQWKSIKEDIVRQTIAGLPREIVEQKALQMDLIPTRIEIKGVT